MRWGFMNSVRTEPRVSLLPYSTRVSSPALKIMHTWGWVELSRGGKFAWRKRPMVVEGSVLSVQSDPHFSHYSVPLPTSPSCLYLLSPQPLATCHPTDIGARGGLLRWWRLIELYSHFHFRRNTSHCHQIPAKLPVTDGGDIKNNVGQVSKATLKEGQVGGETEFRKVLMLHKRGAASDSALGF